MTELSQQFDLAMMEVYQRAKTEANYNASIFHQMLVRQRGVATAKQLINAPHPSDGYAHLHERGCLHLTVEAVVVENKKWHPLFTNGEIAKARARLLAFGYTPKE
jgi:hypothetical protein